MTFYLQFPKSPKIHSPWYKNCVYYLTFQKQMPFSVQQECINFFEFNERKNEKGGKRKAKNPH